MKMTSRNVQKYRLISTTVWRQDLTIPDSFKIFTLPKRPDIKPFPVHDMTNYARQRGIPLIMQVLYVVVTEVNELKSVHNESKEHKIPIRFPSSN
jgi:hypothetical protein